MVLLYNKFVKKSRFYEKKHRFHKKIGVFCLGGGIFKLARLKADGKKLGRPFGSKSRELKLEKHKKRLEWMLKRGFSKPKIAKLLGVHKCTIYNYLKNENINLVD